MDSNVFKTILCNESKLVKRNWLFYFFILGITVYMVTALIPRGHHPYPWTTIALPGSIPLNGAKFLNLFQAIVIAFMTCDIYRKRKKAETRVSLLVRPASNGQFFLGEFLGIFIPFFIADSMFMCALVLVNLVTPDIPVDPSINLFYLFTHVLPVLVFISGVSLFLNRSLKHPLLAWITLVGFLYCSYAYLTTPIFGILDFRGHLLPDSFSTIVGHAHLPDYMLQRSYFLLLGGSLLFFSAPLSKRIPNHTDRRARFFVPASLLLLVASGVCFAYLNRFQDRQRARNEYRETFFAHEGYPKARVLSHEIFYRPMGKRFAATSRMKIQNQKNVNMGKILLYLNPGLSITALESGEKQLRFHRVHQVILVDHTLAPRESVDIKMEYEGSIDEDIYQLDINDDFFFSPPMAYYQDQENYGKRYAFVSDAFTLLVPEVMWYPMTVAPVKRQFSREINFTHYFLEVSNPNGLTVLSQGEATQDGGRVKFCNLHPQTGISLCIGKYEKRTVSVDSISIELYTYPGNDFYMKPLDDWDEEIASYPDKEEYIARLKRQCRDFIEADMPNPYPFKYLKIVETPSSFLHRSLFSDHIQPEIVFFPERLCQDFYKPGDSSLAKLQSQTEQEYLLLNCFLPNLLRMEINRLFTDFHRSISSNKYNGINLIYDKMLQSRLKKEFIQPSSLNHTVEKDLNTLIQEGYSSEREIVINLKILHLLSYLSTITTWDSLNRFMEDFNARIRFLEVDFDSFIKGFEERFGQDIRSFIDDWYTTRQLPRLEIKDLTLYETGGKRIIDFKVGNPGKTDGIVSIVSQKQTIAGTTITDNLRGFLIKPGEYKHIVVHEDLHDHILLTTNFSGCLPAYTPFSTWKVSQLPETIPGEGCFTLDKDDFYPPGEIIIDNEDPGFHIIDSTDNRKHLIDLINNDRERGYHHSLIDYITTNTWKIPILTEKAYGKYIHSAFAKTVGSGKCKAEWIASLPEAGNYEIFIYRPAFEEFVIGECKYSTNYPGMKNYYTVHTSQGPEEIELEVRDGDPCWVSLGNFNLPAGESRVVLDDRGEELVKKRNYQNQQRTHYKYYRQIIAADAVKWVKIK